MEGGNMESRDIMSRIQLFLLIVLVIAVLVLGALYLSGRSALGEVVKKYQADHLGSSLIVQHVSGDEAKAAVAQLSALCPGFNGTDFYVAEIANVARQESKLYVVSVAGKQECMVDRSVKANGTQTVTQPGLAKDVILTVNGEAVTNEEVMAVYNGIPQNLRTNTSLQQALEQVVNNKLLLEDAVKRKLSVADSEVDAAFSTLLSSNGLTAQVLEDNLKKSGSSIDQFRDSLRKDLLLQKEVLEVTKDVPNATSADVSAYYDVNKNNITSIGSASVRQLLIYANESTKDSKLAEIKAVATKLNATNFCELVSQYSEDKASSGKCGQYDFKQGDLLPEFEGVVFNSSVGETKLFGTRIGFHIVHVLNVTAPRKLSFDESQKGISDYLLLTKKQVALIDYIKALKDKAEIVNYAK
jgi:parvulin-like peptidyl-prolyl isomerase